MTADARHTLLDVTYYTDPLCSWSWAFEPVWRRLRFALGPALEYRYRMAGMIPDWSRYVDPVNDIGSPAHMGPRWLEVSRTSGMPIAPEVWQHDPPASSYPACLAVKAAGMQGPDVADRYLRRLREAVMLEGRNIAKREVLLAVGAELSAADREAAPTALDVGAFERALGDGSALEAFRDDIRDVRDREIGRFPTLLVRGAARSVLLTGYRPWEALIEAISAAAGEAFSLSAPDPAAADYESYWRDVVPRLTEPEIREACGHARP